MAAKDNEPLLSPDYAGNIRQVISFILIISSKLTSVHHRDSWQSRQIRFQNSCPSGRTQSFLSGRLRSLISSICATC